MKKLITLVITVILLPKIYANEVTPNFALIYSTADDSSLSMECFGKTPFKNISCSFVQTRISKKNIKDIEEEIKDMKKAKDKDIEQMLNVCKTLEKTKQDALKDISAPNKISKIKDDISFFEDLCLCNTKKSLFSLKSTKDCMIEKFTARINSEINTCKIAANKFELNFERVNQNKWISNPGPKGICNLVNIAIIEKDSKYNVWTFSQTRVSGDTESELCKHFELNKPIIYSWKSDRESKIKCEKVKFDVI